MSDPEVHDVVAAHRNRPPHRNLRPVRNRARPLVFSLRPRCHGLPGSQKYTGIPVAFVRAPWQPISLPWSYVSDRTRVEGNERNMVIGWATRISGRSGPTPEPRSLRFVFDQERVGSTSRPTAGGRWYLPHCRSDYPLRDVIRT